MKSDLELIFDYLCDVGVAETADGDVESPAGYFALVLIGSEDDLNDTRRYLTDLDSDLDLTGLERGFYVVRIDSQGFTDWIPYDTAMLALSAYAELEAIYVEWLGADI